MVPSESHEEIADLPIDPHEPTYCKCKQVAFGQMIACDNPLVRAELAPAHLAVLASPLPHLPQCQVEWYHFQCVGLAHRPTGSWLCQECTRGATLEPPIAPDVI